MVGNRTIIYYVFGGVVYSSVARVYNIVRHKCQTRLTLQTGLKNKVDFVNRIGAIILKKHYS